jgi:hypothetical protein
MIDLIIYISDLKSQLSVRLTNHILYSYLINALRFNLRDEIIRRIIRNESLESRAKLEEIARMIEKMMHDDDSKNRRSRIERDTHRYSSYDRFKRSDNAQKAIHNSNDRDRDRERDHDRDARDRDDEMIRATIEVDSKILRRTSSRLNVTTAKRRITTRVSIDSRRSSRKMRRRLNRTIRKKPSISRRSLDRAESNS